jgi:ElaB/YqjD/DUF883 family membrane-anchored ribosome-binding protein
METYFENIETAHASRARELVVEDLKSLLLDYEDLLKATADDVSDKAKEARSRVTAALDRAKATCKHLQEHTAAAARVAGKEADAVVRRHPYESIGIAFGIGLLIGVLVKRK